MKIFKRGFFIASMKNLRYYFMFLFVGSIQAQSMQEVGNKMDQIPGSQTQSISAIAGYITSQFASDEDKIAAIFYWTAHAIRYDVPGSTTGQYDTQTSADKVQSALSSRKGVCMHYSEVFKALALACGIPTELVSGYTKQYGKISTQTHQWCMARINGTWELFDPTWGAGVVNDQEYTPQFNFFFFRTPPAALIESHYPFDYLWQLLPNPLSPEQFKSNETGITGNKVRCNPAEEIPLYFALSANEKSKVELKHLEIMGISNGMLRGEAAFLKRELSYHALNNTSAKLEQVVADFNASITAYNRLILFRNKQFKPALADEDLLALVQLPYADFTQAYLNLMELKEVDRALQGQVVSLKKSFIDTKKAWETQLAFVQLYVSKPSQEREQLFFIKPNRGK